MNGRGSKWPLFAAFAIVAWFYVWTALSDNLSWRWGREQTDYYNLLVDGFLRGQLSLAVEPQPELLAVADPYDPAQRPPGVGLHDATFFRGRYYIYFGVVPAVVVLLPFRLLTGIDLPLDGAVLFLVLTGYALALWLLADIRRRFFPAVGPVAFAFIAIVLGFASGTAVLIRRASMYDLPIASGYCFSTLALVCWYRALSGSARRAWWIAASSLGWGLAIGSRPIYLLAPVCLVFAWRFFTRGEDGQILPAARRARLLAAALMPVAFVGGLLALYNYLRYGSVTEFGLRYVLSGVYESKIEKFRLRYVPWNFHARFFATGEWSRYFPFLPAAPELLPRPRQHYWMDFAFPVLVNMPFLWLAALVPVAWRAAPADASGRAWRLFVVSVGWMALTVTGFVLCFYATMARYIGDFAPGLALLAVIGALAGLAWVEKRGAVARRSGKSLLAAFGVVTVFTLFLFSVTVYDRVRPYNPATFAALARVANTPVHWFDVGTTRAAPENQGGSTSRTSAASVPPAGLDPRGIFRLRVEFPEGVVGRREPLVTSGQTGRGDVLSVEYLAGNRLRFVLDHWGRSPYLSPALAYEPGRGYRVEIAHPFYATNGLQRRPAGEGMLTVDIDGQRVWECEPLFYPMEPEDVYVGHNPIGGSLVDEKFSGTIAADVK